MGWFNRHLPLTCLKKVCLLFYLFHNNMLEYPQSAKLKSPYNVREQNRDEVDEVKRKIKFLALSSELEPNTKKKMLKAVLMWYLLQNLSLCCLQSSLGLVAKWDAFLRCGTRQNQPLLLAKQDPEYPKSHLSQEAGHGRKCCFKTHCLAISSDRGLQKDIIF